MLDEVNKLVGITPFIVIECDQLKKVGVYLNAFPCIEAGGVGIADKVRRYHLVFDIVQDPGKLIFTGFLHLPADILIGCRRF